MFKKISCSVITFLFITLISQTAFATSPLENRPVPGKVPVNFSVKNGVLNYSVLIKTPPGRGNNQPNLILTYNGAGNGEMGKGWSMGGRSAIYRVPATLAQDGDIAGIDFSDTDRYSIDGHRLMPINGGVNGGAGTEYRTEIDTYSQIISYGGTANNPEHWVVKTKEGQVLTYGAADDDVEDHYASLTFPDVETPDGTDLPGGTTIWSLKTVNDTTGNNPIEYYYNNDKYTPYLDKITYMGGSVDLIYNDELPDYNSDTDNRMDIPEKYFHGQKIVMDKRLAKIEVYGYDVKIQEYLLTYDNSGSNKVSRLVGLEVCDGQENCFPEQSFAWDVNLDADTSFEPYTRVSQDGKWGDNLDQRWFPADVNGDGRTDLVRVFKDDKKTSIDVKISAIDEDGNQFFEHHPWMTQKDGWDSQWDQWFVADVNGDGLSDIVRLFIEEGDYGFVYSSIDVAINTGTGFINESWMETEGYSPMNDKFFAIDANGDGLTDIVKARENRDGGVDIGVAINTGSAFTGFGFSEFWLENAGIWKGDAEWFGVDVNGDGMSDLVQVWKDGSGDNAVSIDTFISKGAKIDDGTGQVTGFTHSNWLIEGGDYSDKQEWFVADVNGDGMIDIVRAYKDGKTDDNVSIDVKINTGISFVHKTWLENSRKWRDIYEWFAVDVDGDGADDLVKVWKDGDNVSIDAYISDNDNPIELERFQGETWLTQGGIWDSNESNQRWFAGDVDGDGLSDIIRVYKDGSDDNNASIDVKISQAKKTQVKEIVSNGTTTSITYEPLTNSEVYTKGTGAEYPVNDVQYPSYVVSSLQTSDGVGGMNTVNYHYEGLKRHLRGRGSYGYAKITETYPDNGKTLKTWYNQNGFPLSGKQIKIEQSYFYDDELINDYVLIDNSTRKYEKSLNDDGVYQVYQSELKGKKYKLNGDLIITVTSEFGEPDDYGNIGQIIKTTTDGTQTFIETTDSIYSNDTTNWFLGRLTKRTVTRRAPGQLPSARRSTFEYYTAADADPAAEIGLLKSKKVVSIDAGPEDEPLKTTTYAYNDYGQKIGTQIFADNKLKRWSGIVYDDAVSAVQPSGSCVANSLINWECQSFAYTPDEGWLETVTDRNDLITSYDYDGFGRMTNEIRPDDTETTIERHLAYDEDGVANPECGEFLADFADTCTVTQSTGTGPVIVQYDSLAREVRKIVTGFDVRLVYSDIEYNHLGQVSRVSRDYFMGDHVYWANSLYDDLGRVRYLDEPAPHGARNSVETVYNGLSTTVSAGPEQRQKTTITDAIGQVIHRAEQGSFIDYTYWADGNLKTTTVANDPATTVTLFYDEFGRKTAMYDPDMGGVYDPGNSDMPHWTYAYNGLGEMTSQIDAKGQTITMEYDKQGRLISKLEKEKQDDGSFIDIETINAYGLYGADPGSVGKLLSTSDGTVTKTYAYDLLGRLEYETTDIDGQIFTSQTEYDDLSRVKEITYPGSDGFYVQNLYNDNGFLETVRGLRLSSEVYDEEQLQLFADLVDNATTLAGEFNTKAQELRTIGEFYKSKIDQYTEILAQQTIIFEHGTTTGLDVGAYYQLWFSSDWTKGYIGGKIVASCGGTIVQTPTAYYQVTESNGEQTIAEIDEAELNPPPPTAIGDRIYVINETTITTAYEYISTLNNHTDLLSDIEAKASSAFKTNDDNGTYMSLDPTVLEHINNTIDELEILDALIEELALGYAENADNLILLAEQTLAAADNSLQYERTLINGAAAYGDFNNISAYINYWKALDVDASGRISAEVYGNGVVNDYAYNQATGQLQQINSGLLASVPLRHLEYQYDSYQNVRVRQDFVNDIREEFLFDGMDRLTYATVESGLYDAPGIYDVFNNEQLITYDVFGNITSKSVVGTYTYGPSELSPNAGPHAVTSVTPTEGAIIKYEYDANGNMVSGDGRTITWNRFNKPVSIAKDGKAAYFYYGPDQARYKKVSPAGDTTLYIGNLYEHVTKANQSTEEKFYIYANGQMVAERIVDDQQDPQTVYLHKDALGSVDLVTDVDGKVVERRSYDPWGNLRNMPWKDGVTDPSLSQADLPFTNKGYTGHEHIQEVGLIHMNGRVFDPVLARFISADPYIQAPGLSQSFNRYSYVFNNPLKYTDPSGYFGDFSPASFSGSIGVIYNAIWTIAEYYADPQKVKLSDTESLERSTQYTTVALDRNSVGGWPVFKSSSRGYWTYLNTGEVQEAFESNGLNFVQVQFPVTGGGEGSGQASSQGDTAKELKKKALKELRHDMGEDILGYARHALFVTQFVLGVGKTELKYYPPSVEHEEMIRSPQAVYLRNWFYNGKMQDVTTCNYATNRAFRETIWDGRTADRSSIAVQVGGYGNARAIKNGNGTITFTIQNTAGLNSFSYHLLPDNPFPYGPFRNRYQTIQWTEDIKR